MIVFVKGRFAFVHKEYYKRLIEMGVIAEYDTSAKERDKHDEEIREKYGHYTEEERYALIIKSLQKPSKKSRPLQPNEEVVNPWMF